MVTKIEYFTALLYVRNTLKIWLTISELDLEKDKYLQDSKSYLKDSVDKKANLTITIALFTL